MQDPDFGIFDSDLIEDNRLNEVKEYIELRIMGRNALFADRADGPEEFMDAAIDISKGHVDSAIQRMVGYLYTSNFYENESLSASGLFVDRAEKFMAKFEEAFDALMKYLQRDPDFIDQLETTTDHDLGPFTQTSWVA